MIIINIIIIIIIIIIYDTRSQMHFRFSGIDYRKSIMICQIVDIVNDHEDDYELKKLAAVYVYLVKRVRARAHACVRVCVCALGNK